MLPASGGQCLATSGKETNGFVPTAVREPWEPHWCINIVPLSENGPPLSESNLISLCADCHRDRHGQVVDEGKKEWVKYIANLMERFLML